MLIKLSKRKGIPCHIAPAQHDFRPQQNIQEISLYYSPSSCLSAKQARMHRVALLRLPTL